VGTIIAGVHCASIRMTISVMDEIPAPAGSAPTKPPIPDKLFFRIGEVSYIVGVEPYVLRYWESEFRGLSPKKSGSGQRMFRRRDVELLLEIKRLLYERKFTIEGARKELLEKPSQLGVSKGTENRPLLATNPELLPEIRRELVEILKLFVSV